MSQENNIVFATLDKTKWLELIVNSYQKYHAAGNNVSVYISFSDSISVKGLTPMHLVTLACLIQFLSDQGWKAFLSHNNQAVDDYIYNDLRFSEYWLGQKNHVDANQSTHVFNLWRIKDQEKDLYAKNVEAYFKNTYFKNKDLSAINLSLTEPFYNVFDHASANDNAFSLIMYDEDKHVLHAAIADFGIGIVQSVRNYIPSISCDKEALLKAAENNFTVKSTDRNKGKGLDNILSCADIGRLCSGKALLVDIKGERKVYDINFYFPGTLIYFEVDLSQMEDEEVLDSFEF